MEELKRTLAQAYSKGPQMKEFLDQLLGQHQANSVEDLRVVYGEADLDALRLLRQRLDEGRVIARAYTRADRADREQGCVLFWLFGFRSNTEVLAYRYVNESMVKAFARCTRGWDYGLISLETIRGTLDEVIVDRERPERIPDRVRPALAGQRHVAG